MANPTTLILRGSKLTAHGFLPRSLWNVWLLRKQSLLFDDSHPKGAPGRDAELVSPKSPPGRAHASKVAHAAYSAGVPGGSLVGGTRQRTPLTPRSRLVVCPSGRG